MPGSTKQSRLTIEELAIRWVTRSYSDEQDEVMFSCRRIGQYGFIAGYKAALARATKGKKHAR